MKKGLQNILIKVSQLYMKYGIKSVTMDDVSRELGISKKTLYRYVSDKIDLVKKVLYFETAHFEKAFSDIQKSNYNAIFELIEMNRQVHEMVKKYNPTVFYDLNKYYPTIFSHFMSERHQKMYKLILDNIKKGKREGLFRNELNEEVIAKIYVMRVEKMRGDDLCSHHELVSHTFYTELLIYHIRGISNEKGIKEFEKYSNQFKLKKV